MNKVCKLFIKFRYLILGEILKLVATRCQILRLKCTEFDFGWGSAPDPAGGAYSAPPDPPSWILGALLLREEKGRGKWEGTGGALLLRKGNREGREV